MLEVLLEYIQARYTKLPGIFRLPGDTLRVDALCQHLLAEKALVRNASPVLAIHVYIYDPTLERVLTWLACSYLPLFLTFNKSNWQLRAVCTYHCRYQ